MIYDARENTFTFKKDGRKHNLPPFNDENPKEQVSPRVML